MAAVAATEAAASVIAATAISVVPAEAEAERQAGAVPERIVVIVRIVVVRGCHDDAGRRIAAVAIVAAVAARVGGIDDGLDHGLRYVRVGHGDDVVAGDDDPRVGLVKV